MYFIQLVRCLSNLDICLSHRPPYLHGSTKDLLAAASMDQSANASDLNAGKSFILTPIQMGVTSSWSNLHDIILLLITTVSHVSLLYLAKKSK